MLVLPLDSMKSTYSSLVVESLGKKVLASSRDETSGAGTSVDEEACSGEGIEEDTAADPANPVDGPEGSAGGPELVLAT